MGNVGAVTEGTTLLTIAQVKYMPRFYKYFPVKMASYPGKTWLRRI